MVLDSPHIFSLCDFRSLSSSSYPWLVALWFLITINASFCPLPLPISCLVWDTLRLWISSFFPTLYYPKSRARSFSLGMDLSFLHLLLRLPALFQLYFRHSPRTYSILVAFSGVFPFSFSPSLLCCSMGNTGNHGERVCDIHGDLAVVRYEQRLCLLACRGLESVEGYFCLYDWDSVKHFLHFNKYVKFIKNSPYVCTNMYVLVRAHVALPITTLWPGSLGPPLPRATPTGDPKESSMRYRLSLTTFH